MCKGMQESMRLEKYRAKDSVATYKDRDVIYERLGFLYVNRKK